jgi:hypothetical protein
MRKGVSKYKYSQYYYAPDGRRLLRPLCSVWRSMKARCLNPSCEAYGNYGGRGIAICDEWLDWDSFADWGYSNGYEQGLFLDRVDNNGNYEPSNCRFVTMAVSNANKGSVDGVTYGGKYRLTMREAASMAGLSYGAIRWYKSDYKTTAQEAFDHYLALKKSEVAKVG